MIKVKLFATFRNGREKEIHFEYYEGITGREIIEKLGIKEEEVAIFIVNGRDKKWDEPIEDEATVSLFPPVGGG
ncbi:MAG: MoaD/ThiS family protein [Tissierellales bacterium]|jgi:molybdopterin converting factor small subunit|nr:MoaD/ThiS family protein [Tissierellales bacterium]